MNETGTLIVQVTTSRARLPVEGATVVITSPVDEGRHDLISLTETDQSGLSGPIRLQVPPSDDGGRTPGGPTPYSMYFMWVEHPDYEVAFVESLQVFPGVESVQQISMIPLNGSGSNSGDISGDINATAQNL